MNKFEETAELIKKINLEVLSDEEKLEIYSLFKQGSIGDVNTPKPGMFALKDKAKWNAWESKKGMSQDEAKKQYVELAKKYLS